MQTLIKFQPASRYRQLQGTFAASSYDALGIESERAGAVFNALIHPVTLVRSRSDATSSHLTTMSDFTCRLLLVSRYDWCKIR
jgi:hypothetical protein